MNLQQKAQRIVDEAVANGSENSVQFCVYKNGACIINVCAGYMDFERTRKIDERTLFPIYSTSKGVPATALNRLIEQGKLSAETPVREIWPEFARNGKKNTLIRHFLNHTSGLHQRFPEQKTYEFVADWNSMLRVIENSAPDWIPGTQTRYQSLTYGWITAEIIQRITGMSFREYTIRELFKPAGIEDFYFGMTDESEQHAAAFRLGPGWEPSRSISVCDPLDELMRQPCIRRAALPGFNGFASAHALARLYNEILHERYFSHAMLIDATTMRRPEPGPPTLNSWNCFGNGYALSGPVDDVGCVFGHGGYGGSDALADRSQDLAVGFTAGILGDHPCKAELFRLAGLVQRRGWKES